MKKSVNESGITLIALVVTIVVLLILAGITITYVLADGGIFDSANDAKYEQVKGTISDYVAVAQSTMLIESYQDATYDANKAWNTIDANFPDEGYALAQGTLGYSNHKYTGAFKVTVGDTTYTVTFADDTGVATITYTPGATS